MKLPIVGVMGSGSDEHVDLATPLGVWLAGQAVHLLTGGGPGVMTSVTRAFWEAPNRRGLTIGVLPAAIGGGAREGYPNDWVEVPIQTHLPLVGERGQEIGSRNPINVLSSNVVVALPGGVGTASEVLYASRHDVPVVAYLDDVHSIPDLPPGVPVFTDLRGVQRFVRQHTGRLSEG